MVSQVVNNKPSSPIASCQRYQAPGRPIIQELKLKYEIQASESPKTPKHKLPKLLKKFKVKQIASLFNSKISQLLRRDGVVNQYNTLANELSPPPKRVRQATLPKTLPLHQTRYTTENAPVHSPRTSSASKLETVDIKQNEKHLLEDKEIDAMITSTIKPIELSIDSTLKISQRKNKCVLAVPQQHYTKQSVSSESSTTSSAKHSEVVESDSGISNLAKNTSDESEHENHDKSMELNFTKPVKPMRKKKTHSTIIWKRNSSLVEAKAVSSSESDCKDPKHTINETVNKPQALDLKPVTDDVPPEPRFVKLDKSLMRVENSPHKIKSSLLQNTWDESQHECHEKPKEDVLKDFSFAKPTNPMRKKKTRRTLNWIRNSSLVETNTLSTTDSESDCKKVKHTIKKTARKPRALDLKQVTDDIQPDPSFVGLDVSLMRVVNSPRTIKSAYTLTVFTPPPHKGPSLNKRREARLQKDMFVVGLALGSQLYEEKHKLEAHSHADIFDQGFTDSNEVDSPIRQRRKSVSYQSAIEPARKIPETQSNFSTPIKIRGRQNLISAFNGSGVPQQIFSPIAMPLKIRRSSIYDNDSRRTSIAMQVINEDHSLEHHGMQSPSNINNTDVFFSNAPTVDMTSPNTQNTSSFWIKSGDFSIALDIYNNDPERVKLLYETFSKTSCDTKEIHFGIDGHQFSVHSANDEENYSQRMTQNNEMSHYWFSTGDLTIPFSGKLLTSEKIQRLFQFIKASVEETGVLRFGVDEVEFSSVPEFWTQMPKLSMESNYSLLVGLQSGNSNGLEGRSTYAWPHSKPLSVSDMNQSHFESEVFEENESARSFIGGNLFELASCTKERMMPRNSETMAMSPESFCKAYDSEPLDLLFEDKRYLPQSLKW